MKNRIFQVEKQNIYQVHHAEAGLAPLPEGTIRLKIEQYALTTNNITYAVSGFKLRYWEFYPTEEPYGIIPVWGYGEVIASDHPEIKTGERCYGYFPMATYCTLLPDKVNPFSFSDGTPHRQELAAIYNRYIRVSADAVNDKELENYMPIFRPLFATSFLIYQFLQQQDFLGAEQIIITSASAKTSLALAFMLRQNQMKDGRGIIALTSPRNIDFVRSADYYDEVLAYDNYKDINLKKTVVVDVSGKHDLLANLSAQFGDQLVHIALVGLTDWQSAGRFSDLSNAKFFFAPTHLQAFYELHGAAKGNQLMREALRQFIRDMKHLMDIQVITDLETLSDLYLKMVRGDVDPRKGYLVQL